MRVIFFGSPDFAVPALEALHVSRHAILKVLTQPDRPAGRGKHLQPTAVRSRAEELGYPVETPEKINRRAQIDALLAHEPDALVVAAYGLWMPTRLIESPPHGSINIHPSLLPKYRGAAPMEWAVINGETRTGVSIMRQVKEWDAGPVFVQEEVEINPDETAGELAERLSRLGADLLVQVLDQMETTGLAPAPQDDSLATFAPKLTPELEAVDWTNNAPDIANLIRGLSPAPGAHSTFRGNRLKLLRARFIEGVTGEPGMVVEVRKREGPVVAAPGGGVLLTELQPAGKRPMSGKDFCNGQRVQAGEVFGE